MYAEKLFFIRLRILITWDYTAHGTWWLQYMFHLFRSFITTRD